MGCTDIQGPGCNTILKSHLSPTRDSLLAFYRRNDQQAVGPSFTCDWSATFLSGRSGPARNIGRYLQPRSIRFSCQVDGISSPHSPTHCIGFSFTFVHSATPSEQECNSVENSRKENGRPLVGRQESREDAVDDLGWTRSPAHTSKNLVQNIRSNIEVSSTLVHYGLLSMLMR
eukprot:scaffold312_cov409-Pavlova_lutheri.AAC.13